MKRIRFFIPSECKQILESLILGELVVELFFHVPTSIAPPVRHTTIRQEDNSDVKSSSNTLVEVLVEHDRVGEVKRLLMDQFTADVGNSLCVSDCELVLDIATGACLHEFQEAPTIRPPHFQTETGRAVT